MSYWWLESGNNLPKSSPVSQEIVSRNLNTAEKWASNLSIGTDTYTALKECLPLFDNMSSLNKNICDINTASELSRSSSLPKITQLFNWNNSVSNSNRTSAQEYLDDALKSV